MEFFDKETDHMKYMATLSGRYTYSSRVLMLVFSAVIVGVIAVVSAYRTFTPIYVLAVLLVLLIILALNIPCSYSADDSGFTIVSGIVSRYFSYSDVHSVTVENRIWGHTKGGGTIYENVLTVSTDKGIYRFHEKSGIVRRRSLRYIPDSDQVTGRHIELVRLKEFITARI